MFLEECKALGDQADCDNCVAVLEQNGFPVVEDTRRAVDSSNTYTPHSQKLRSCSRHHTGSAAKVALPEPSNDADFNVILRSRSQRA